MCIGCTISKHWLPLLSYFERGPLSVDPVWGDPDNIYYAPTIKKMTEMIESGQTPKEALKVLFMEHHVMKEGEKESWGIPQIFPREKCEEMWNEFIGDK